MNNKQINSYVIKYSSTILKYQFPQKPLAYYLPFCYYLTMVDDKETTDDSKKEPPKKANAHDRRYRRLFSNPLIVEELMKYFVDETFADELDFSKMELQNTSFVSEEHKKSEADMIWKINFRGNDLYIYLLIEFQSTVDKFMALRFGSYIFEFYKWLLFGKNIDTLPAVFPILIYNGNKAWTAVDNIKDLINSSIPKEYIPSFRYYKIIENELPKEKLLKIHNALSMVFYVENATAEEIKNGLSELYDLLKDENPTLINEFNLWFNNLLLTAGYEMGDSKYTIEKLNNLKEVKTMFSTALKEHEEKYRQLGLKEGIQKGIEQGEEKGRREERFEMALKLLGLGVEKGVVSKATGLSSKDLDELS